MSQDQDVRPADDPVRDKDNDGSVTRASVTDRDLEREADTIWREAVWTEQRKVARTLNELMLVGLGIVLLLIATVLSLLALRVLE